MVNKLLFKSVLIIGLCASLYFLGVVRTDAKWQIKSQAAITQAVNETRAKERQAQDEIDKITQQQINDMAGIAHRLNDDLIGLQQRESRRNLPRDSPAECKGASGRELSKEDSEFLTREAARADRYAVALTACYTYADKIKALSESK